MKAFYGVGYRLFRMPWEGGPRSELVDVVESRRIQPSRAIDLGCGAGSNAVYLAQHGFDVTGVDFAAAAITKALRRALTAGARASFVVDDVTQLRHVSGVFDFLVDSGTFDDLTPAARDRYLTSLLALTHAGSQYLLWCVWYEMRWWEHFIPFFPPPLTSDEARRRFGESLSIERIAGERHSTGWPPIWAADLMTRRTSGR